MAEAAGLIIGGVSLITMFSAALTLFEGIRFGKSFGQDYETALTKLMIVKLRLSRWAESVQSQKGDIETLEEEGKAALRILERIKYHFEETRKLSLKYNGDISLYDPIRETKRDVRRLVSVVGKIMSQRQKNTTILQKTVWAVYDRERFNRLLDDVTMLVDNLVDLFSPDKFPTFTQKQELLCEEDANVLIAQDKATLEIITGAAAEVDKILQRRIETGLQMVPRHTYIRNEISGRAKVKYGDEYLRGSRTYQTESRGHIYQDNIICGDVFVHCGDTFGGVGFLEAAMIHDARRR